MVLSRNGGHLRDLAGWLMDRGPCASSADLKPAPRRRCEVTHLLETNGRQSAAPSKLLPICECRSQQTWPCPKSRNTVTSECLSRVHAAFPQVTRPALLAPGPIRPCHRARLSALLPDRFSIHRLKP